MDARMPRWHEAMERPCGRPWLSPTYRGRLNLMIDIYTLFAALHRVMWINIDRPADISSCGHIVASVD